MTKRSMQRIVIDPRIMVGQPVIKGTRITVAAILRKLSQNIAPKEILADYPHLTHNDLKAALEYAAESIASEEVHLTPARH
jgi:uncharacterized protein (DUF433 family)